MLGSAAATALLDEPALPLGAPEEPVTAQLLRCAPATSASPRSASAFEDIVDEC